MVDERPAHGDQLSGSDHHGDVRNQVAFQSEPAHQVGWLLPAERLAGSAEFAAAGRWLSWPRVPASVLDGRQSRRGIAAGATHFSAIWIFSVGLFDGVPGIHYMEVFWLRDTAVGRVGICGLYNLNDAGLSWSTDEEFRGAAWEI